MKIEKWDPDWEAIARHEGWTVGVDDDGDPCLVHVGLDRLWWPANDWRGAAEDVGFDLDDDDDE